MIGKIQNIAGIQDLISIIKPKPSLTETINNIGQNAGDDIYTSLSENATEGDIPFIGNNLNYFA